MTVFSDRLLPSLARSATARTCVLEQVLGCTAACPQHRCAFWEEGGTVIRPGCALSRTPLDLERAGAADRLLGLKRRMEQPFSTEDEREASREFRRVLAAAFDDDWD